MERPGRRLALALLLAAAFAAIALAVHHAMLGAPLGSDARFLTYRNAFVRDPGGLFAFWTADFFQGAITHGVPYLSGYYRPVTNLDFWLEYRLAGETDAFYRASQVLLHAVASFLVLLVVHRVTREPLAALGAGLLFLVHPVNAFAATEPAARADVLFPIFFLAAVLVFERAVTAGRGPADPDGAGAGSAADAGPPADGGRDHRRGILVALTVGLYLLAALSKEMAVTLPAVLVLVVLLRRYTDGVPWRRLLLSIPVWVAFGAYLLWRFVILDLAAPSIGYADVHSTPVLLLGGMKSLLIHLSRIVLPLGADYPELNPGLVNYAADPLRDPLTWAALATLAGLGGLALLWRRRPTVAFWCAFFLVTFSPLLRVDSIAGTLSFNVILTQERWIYLPAVAIVALAGMGLARLARAVPRGRPRALGALSVGLVLVVLAWSAASHAGRHRDPFARLRQLYLIPPERLSSFQEANRLILYARWVAVPRGEIDEAERRTRRAVELVPDSPIPAVAYAQLLARRGDWRGVRAALERWRSPTVEELRALQAENYRVADDYNRVNPAVVYLLARAHAHLGEGGEAMALLCDAARRGVDPGEIGEALREAYALHGPPRCLSAERPRRCAAGVVLPDSLDGAAPLDPAACDRWRGWVEP